MRQDAKAIADQISANLGSQLKSLVKGDDPKPSDDPCITPKDKQSPQIPAFCTTRKKALAEADLNHTYSVEDAMSELDSAKRAWTRSRGQYDFSMRTAQIALEQRVATAIAAYDSKFDQNFGSPMIYLYFTQKQAIAAEMLGFEGSATAAGTSFAAATGALLGAYQTYLTTIETAAAQQLEDMAAAEQSFWQSVEGVLA
jgi:hypothetical protein